MSDALAVLHELERTDAEASAALATLDELSRQAERLGAEATTLSMKLARLPLEREAAEVARIEAEREVEERRAEHARAEGALADAADEAAARRDELRARDLLHSSERRSEASRTAEERLEAEAEAAEREAAALAVQARELAEARQLPPPEGDSLEELAGWATQARATLFVARAQLAAQREAVIRQANELGSAVLGEPLVAQSAALVARRVEEATASSGPPAAPAA